MYLLSFFQLTTTQVQLLGNTIAAEGVGAHVGHENYHKRQPLHGRPFGTPTYYMHMEDM
jgi:hypothetical protein